MAADSLLPAFIDVYFSTIKNIDSVISRPMSEYRLSFEQYQILYDIAHTETLSLTDIVKKRGVTKPAIARQLRVLRDLGYVSQKIAGDDRRRHILALTPLGKRVEQQAGEAARSAFDDWVDRLGEDKMKALLSLLKEVGDKIQD